MLKKASVSTPPGIQRVATDFMVKEKDLLRRLRTTEAHMLTGAEIRILRIQLHLLAIEIYTLPFHQAPPPPAQDAD